MKELKDVYGVLAWAFDYLGVEYLIDNNGDCSCSVYDITCGNPFYCNMAKQSRCTHKNQDEVCPYNENCEWSEDGDCYVTITVTAPEKQESDV